MCSIELYKDMYYALLYSYPIYTCGGTLGLHMCFVVLDVILQSYLVDSKDTHTTFTDVVMSQPYEVRTMSVSPTARLSPETIHSIYSGKQLSLNVEKRSFCGA